ncbi:hypothetical protein RFI_13200 [Reticulomyxa filosa]|uniref:Uncharacterized protein n=1 Tax=Reticulomyxa filosa TaxID=46433 RepID=X6NDI8_RETFI|nr:hypothetical protein RFI_13200 [Reticulomyxa filosa]|eukprot:ETO23958.1 hypothetical protein RFI_13200 [Reticulomyxa filosa]
MKLTKRKRITIYYKKIFEYGRTEITIYDKKFEFRNKHLIIRQNMFFQHFLHLRHHMKNTKIKEGAGKTIGIESHCSQNGRKEKKNKEKKVPNRPNQSLVKQIKKDISILRKVFLKKKKVFYFISSNLIKAIGKKKKKKVGIG